jgi:hypothetical protein
MVNGGAERRGALWGGRVGWVESACWGRSWGGCGACWWERELGWELGGRILGRDRQCRRGVRIPAVVRNCQRTGHRRSRSASPTSERPDGRRFRRAGHGRHGPRDSRSGHPDAEMESWSALLLLVRSKTRGCAGAGACAPRRGGRHPVRAGTVQRPELAFSPQRPRLRTESNSAANSAAVPPRSGRFARPREGF